MISFKSGESMEKCNHYLGTIDDDHDDCVETSLVECSAFDLSTLKQLKNDGFKFKYCPLCGASLEGVLESLINSREEEIKKEKRQEELRKQKQEQAKEKLCKEIAEKTKLCQLN